MLLALLSPAKRLDFSPPPSFANASQPALLKDTALLAAHSKLLSRADLRRLMEISAKLADLNYERFQSFDPKNRTNVKPAIFAFAGDVYMGFDAKTLNADDVAFTQRHIAILSGLYGVLRPLDAIQPYRLEMGTRLRTERGSDLYAFWRASVARYINQLTAALTAPTIVNLASDEYWSAVDVDALEAPVVQPVFKEIKAGKARIVSFLAKKARGMMARFIVQQRLTTPEDLKRFATDGYAFDPKASQGAQLVFTRKSR
ncbi:MAG: peroxide stress protein YaaA [Rhodospirillaceae bacterium]